MRSQIIEHCVGFDWDDGNIEKNQNKHHVSRWECEQIFFNEPLLIHNDEQHSQSESRHFALGQTDLHRCLMIVFTVRNHLLRIISARPMSRKERKYYEEVKKNTEFKSPEEETAFWDKHDTADYIDWSKAEPVRMVNLKPSTRTISLRLPDGLLAAIKVMANKEDVPYQSLMKILLVEAIQLHRRS